MSGRGAERILHVIEWMAEAERPVGFAEACEALSLPKSSTLDLLRILVGAGYAERMADGRYRLLRLPGEPGTGRRGWGTLLRHAEAPLRRAVDLTGESGFIAVLGDDMELRYISKVLPEREIRYDRDVSIHRRPHQVSSGIVLLGRLTPDELQTYIAAERSAGRYADPDEGVTRTVAIARDAGIQINRAGVVEGAGGMAAPIRGRDGQIIAALNIAGPADRLGQALPQIEAVLRETADLISKALGWEPTPDVGRGDARTDD